MMIRLCQPTITSTTPIMSRVILKRGDGSRRGDRHVGRPDRAIRISRRTYRSGLRHQRLVVIAGLAEIAAGSIAMGLGGYLAARTDEDHYESEKQREIRECEEMPEKETEEVAEVFRGYGMSEEEWRR